MQFLKYMHVERFGTEEVEDIEFGDVYVFPKLDGANGSVYYDNGIVKAGSRNRELTLDNDNQGFYKYVLDNTHFTSFLTVFPHIILYGEWLVLHSFKNYRDEAWRQFYVFDCYNTVTYKYLPYESYQPLMEEYNINYIPPLAIIQNGNSEVFQTAIDKNDYLVVDNGGTGEGIVLKNYNFINKYGRQCYAKIVKNEFKDLHRKAMPPTLLQTKGYIEQQIIDEFCSEQFIIKEYNKILISKNSWRSEYIPELLGRVFSEFIKEESWNFIKKFKMPTIDYKVLQKLINFKIKITLKELF